jgi:pyridoxal 5'-phosphate synthase pdxT subunit
MKVGVLALQGDVPEHMRALARVVPQTQIVPVRSATDLSRADALFLPGGESTTIARLLEQADLWRPLVQRLAGGLPVLATCAGLILLARELAPGASGRDPPTFGVLDVTVRRNDYGAQRESFEAPVTVERLSGGPFPGVFIRSPRILSVGPDARPIAWRGDEIVGVQGGSVWGLTFHPELSNDLRVHHQFLTSVARRR